MTVSAKKLPNTDDSSIDCTIIIPTRDMLRVLQPCVESVLRFTNTQSIEIIIIDNNSEDPDTLSYFDSLSDQAQVRIIEWPHPFNFSAINNFAAQESRGKILCFLNNDIEIIQHDWLDELLQLAADNKIGAVGCLLTYADKRIQHGGIALDEQSVAKHIAHGEAANFFAANNISQPIIVDAVTAACLLIRKELFLEIEGFDEDNLAVAYNDVDLCLRLQEKDLEVRMHPGICHIHHESVTRKSDDLPENRPRAEKEFHYMQSKWQDRLKGKQYSSGIPSKINDSNNSNSVSLMSSPTDYRRLEQDNLALQEHIERIEEAHRLIEQSIFWRITAPIRALKDLILGRNAKPGSIDVSRPSDGDADAHQDPNLLDTDTKHAHDKKAKKALQEFLESEQRLQFPKFSESELSIVLVFYNQAHLSLLCLKSLLEHANEKYEVVVVDNQSTDETAQLLQRLDNVKIQRNDENLGFVRAVNQAAELASGKYFLLLNNDALIERDTLRSALHTLNSSSDIGAVGAKIKLLDGSLQEAGSIIWQDGACIGYGRGDRPDAPPYMMQRDVDYCSGAFLLMETALFRELNCFDEAFAPAYYEESDFCIRLHKLGYRVVYDPRAEITHYEFASSGGLRGATKLQQAHREILCDKHQDFLTSQYENDPANILVARTANSFPNVLIIDDRVPYPSLGAGYPRCSHILAAASKLPLNLTFYPLLFVREDWSDVYDLLPGNVEVVLDEGQAGLQNFLRDRQGFYQTIMISRVHNMEIFNELVKHEPNLITDEKIIYDAEAVIAPREVLRRRLWGETITDSEEQLLIAQELKQAGTANRVVAVSESEESLYHQQGIEDTVVLGHTLPSKPTPNSFGERSGILFVGALRDEGSPNVDSLLWFLINCWPAIEREIPNIELFIVGDNSVPSLVSTEQKNVKFLGRLDSIEDYYNSCKVFIAPTRFAAGIPHKVHEAASMGLPSVTTTLLRDQLGWEDENQLLCADQPDAFTAQCIRLCKDEKLWNGIRNSGLKSVADDCSPELFHQRLKTLFDV